MFLCRRPRVPLHEGRVEVHVTAKARRGAAEAGWTRCWRRTWHAAGSRGRRRPSHDAAAEAPGSRRKQQLILRRGSSTRLLNLYRSCLAGASGKGLEDFALSVR